MSIFTDIARNRFHSIKYLESDEIKQTIFKPGIVFRKMFSPLMRMIFSTQSKYKFVVDHREPLNKNGKSKIFVVNHRQSDDMVFSAITAKKNGYFVFGNPILLFESFINGIGLWLNGVILLKRNNPNSRKSTYKKMKYVLKNGGNIIIFPEGYWNLDDNGEADEKHFADGHNSENWLIQDFNIGAFRLAQETQCEIVPVILHYDEIEAKKGYSYRGKAFYISPNDDVFEVKNQVYQYMVDKYFYLMDKYSYYDRKELEAESPLSQQWKELKIQLIADCDIDSVNYKLDLADEKLIGKAKVAKEIPSHAAIFAHLSILKPNKNNAFLFNKRIKG